jgi:hypothetical protein
MDNTEALVSPVYSPSIQPKIVTYYFGQGSPGPGKGQAPEIALLPKVTLQGLKETYNAPIQKYLTVDLSDSTVNPIGNGVLMWNDSDHRGWYTESILVEMWFPGMEDRMDLLSDAPKSTEVSGSSSVTNSLDVSPGLFGGVPLANLSAGFSHSVTASLTDFEVTNLSTKRRPVRVKHEYRLALVEGAAYKEPADLRASVGANVGGWFSNKGFMHLYDLPPRAKSSFPIISQALFRADRSQSVPDTADLHICITGTFVDTKMAQLFGPQGYANKQTIRHEMTAPIPFGHIQ